MSLDLSVYAAKKTLETCYQTSWSCPLVQLYKQLGKWQSKVEV